MKRKRQISKIRIFSLLAVITLASLGFTRLAFADTGYCGEAETSIIRCDAGGDGAIWAVINMAINILTVGIGVAATIGIIWSGFLILSARDDESQVAKGKKRIINTVIGLIVYGLFWTIMNLLTPKGDASVLTIASGVESISIQVQGESYLNEWSQISVTVTPQGASNTSYSIRTSDPSVTMISGSRFKCQKKGSATLTVISANSKTATTEVTCKTRPASNPSNPTNPDDGGGNEQPGTEPVQAASGLNSANGFQYWLNVPQGATNNMPILVFMHGSGEVGAPNSVRYLTQTTQMFSRSDFISIVPVAPSHSYFESHTTDLKNVINQVATTYRANKNRIYIWGFSMGGRATFSMVNDHTTFFKAYIVVANCPNGYTSAANYSKIPVKLMLGGGDRGDYGSCMSSAKYAIEQYRGAGSVELEIIGNATHAQTSGQIDYPGVFSWFNSH